MWKIVFFLFVTAAVTGCSPGLAPNGKSWQEFHAAKYRMVVVYKAAEVANCQDLGPVHGASYEDVAVAKERAEYGAVMLGADHLLITELWTEWAPYNPFRRLQEKIHAEGVAYRCEDE